MIGDPDMFDEYLDACLAGVAPRPEEFLARYPDASEELRERVHALYTTRQRASEEHAPGDLPFERIGDFRLLHPLDKGGMGLVFVAEQESLGRVVALKIVRPEWAGRPETERRFEREAQVVAQLRHPGIVTVYDAGVDRDVRYLAMELVPGRMLSDVLDAAASDHLQLPVERVIRWGAQLARALHYAHQRGIVHRDVKPHNIRITPDDHPLLLDFGIAVDLTGGGAAMTQEFRGSPAYAAPEQIAVGAVDGRTDVHGLGATLYQALCGTVPYAAPTVEGVFHQVLHESARPLRERIPGISIDVETIIGKAMEKRPEERYQSAAELAEDLEAVLAYRPVSAHPPGPLRRLAKWSRRRPAHAVAIGASLLFLLGLLGMLAFQHAEERQEREREARALVARAQAGLTTYGRIRREAQEVTLDVALGRYEQRNRYFTPKEDRKLDQLEAGIQAGLRKRQAIYHEVLEALRRAERLSPAIQHADRIRASLFVEKLEEARAARDNTAAAFYRKQAELLDPEGLIAERAARTGAITLAYEHPQAQCWIFRYEARSSTLLNGGQRLVPVPYPAGSAPPSPYGSTVLRVSRGAGAVHEGDLLLSLEGEPIGGVLRVEKTNGRIERLASVGGKPIDGEASLEEALATPKEGAFVFGIGDETLQGPSLRELGWRPLRTEALAERGGSQAEVYASGEVRSLRLPPGLVVRRTASPLFSSPDNRIGQGVHKLPLGEYLIVARAPGHEEARLAIRVHEGGSQPVRPELMPIGSTPPGLVRVPKTAESASFLIMEREVTCAEYLAFLNDPATLATIHGLTTALVPRDLHGRHSWGRDASGRIALSNAETPHEPVHGVSAHDALAYAAWLGVREGARYRLPSEAEWDVASCASILGWAYPYGHIFSPKWVSSNWARPRARIEPYYRYPIDESPFGIFSLSGSMMEWLDARWPRGSERWRVAGGAWGQADPAIFRSMGTWSSTPEGTSGIYGFRLVRDP